MILKGVNLVLNDKLGQIVLKELIGGYTMRKLPEMVLKEVNWVNNRKNKVVNCTHNDNIMSYSLQRSQLGTQYKIRSYGHERNQLGTKRSS